jgi:putative oxidoreductase
MANSDAARTDPSHEAAAKLFLRLVLGVLILFHGVAKITGGNGFVEGALAKAGMPAELGYLAYVGEVLAPLLLIAGIWTRAAALVVVVNMVVALLLVHTGQLVSRAQSGGYGLELQAMYLFTAIAIALLGAGRYSFGGLRGRWN